MDTQKCIEICNDLLKDELSAMETYELAIKSFHDESEATALKAIHHDHALNAEALKQHIQKMGGSPANDSGAWGSFAKAVQGGSSKLGKEAAVNALLEGEKKGKQDYEDALEKDDMMQEHKDDIRTHLLPRQKEHISTLQRLT